MPKPKQKPRELTGDEVLYRCTRCKKSFVLAEKGYYPRKPCIFGCGNDAQARLDGDESDGVDALFIGATVSQRADIKMFAKDATGRSFGITERGDVIPEHKTIYDTKRDKHGWAATGRKVKGYQKGFKPRNWQS